MPASERWYAFVRALFGDPADALRQLDADPALLNLKGSGGETALHYLAVEGHLFAVELLLRQGADVNILNDSGHSALQESVVFCKIPLPDLEHSEITRALLAQSADPYHSSAILPCAWHNATQSENPVLRGLFASIPPPRTQHTDCEMWLGMCVYPEDSDETP